MTEFYHVIAFVRAENYEEACKLANSVNTSFFKVEEVSRVY